MRRTRVLLFATVGAMLLASYASLLHTKPVQASSNFTVDSKADDADANAGDGTCATSQNACTLRAAIEEANKHSGPDTIAFGIPGTGVQTIQPKSALPNLSDTTGPTTIDGYAQPGSSPNTAPSASNAKIMVQITAAPGTFSVSRGLYVTSPNNTIRGLAIYGIRSPVTLYGTSAQNNTVSGNFVGTDAAGNYAASSYVALGDGVLVTNGAKKNTIGGTSVADRNVVSGNARRGVSIAGLTADFNRVINNLVGLGPNGDKRLANFKHGIDLNSGASQNVVGGTQPGERNVISGNGASGQDGSGVEISHVDSTIENRVIGNFIGTDVTGNAATTYSHNNSQGVHLEDRVNNNEIAQNVIGNNLKGGLRIGFNSSNNSVHDNRIGVSFDGTKPIPNLSHGVNLDNNADKNRIGPNNTIANNPVGIRVSTDNSDLNTITRNSIFANQGRGIVLTDDPNNTDPGANERLAFPAIGGATSQKVTGTACAGCTVEVYEADRGAGVYGEGKRFVGSAIASSDGSFAAAVSGVVVGGYVTATATDAAGNTSQFSLNKAVTE